MKTPSCLLQIGIFTLLIFIFGCGGLQTQSIWNQREFKADAVLSEWPASVWKEKEGMRFAVMNDDNYLSVAITARTQEVGRTIMMRGLTIWFDPLAREKKTIGIRYPIGSPGAQRRPDREGFGEPMNNFAAEFEYISPLEDVPERVPVVAGRGVEVRIRNEEGSVVYELKVPLKPSAEHLYSIESYAGSTISVGIEVLGFEHRRPGKDGTGMQGPSGGSSPRGGAFSSMEPINVWATVQLAQKQN